MWTSRLGFGSYSNRNEKPWKSFRREIEIIVFVSCHNPFGYTVDTQLKEKRAEERGMLGTWDELTEVG